MVDLIYLYQKSSFLFIGITYSSILQFYTSKMRRNLTKSSLGGVSTNFNKESEIEGLKNEVFQLKDLEYDLFRLNDEITSIQAKYSMALDQKDRSENLLREKMTITKNNTEVLENDVETIKLKITQASLDVTNLNRDNATLQRNCENKQNQIINLTISLKQLEKSNETQLLNLRATQGALQKIKQHRNKMQEECQNFCQKLNQNRETLKDLQKETKNKLIVQKSLSETLTKLNQETVDLKTEMLVKQNVLKETTAHYDALANQVKQSTELNQKLDKECKELQQKYNEMTKTLQKYQRTNEEKTQKLRQLENTAGQAQEDLSGCMVKRQKLMKEHTDLATKNKDLNLEIDDCLMKILQLENVNKALQKHISDYINCDEQARILLDRRQKMTQLLQSVGSKLSKTESAIAHLM